MYTLFLRIGGKLMTFAKLLTKHLLGIVAVGFLVSALAVSFVAFSPHPTFAAGAVTKQVSITTNKKGIFTFKPKTLTITVGMAVKWTNNTTVAHTATSDDGKTFNSGIINPGASFSFKFTKKGTFTYHCSIHPFMMATIIVN
jgi:plastocyanin